MRRCPKAAWRIGPEDVGAAAWDARRREAADLGAPLTSLPSDWVGGVRGYHPALGT